MTLRITPDTYAILFDFSVRNDGSKIDAQDWYWRTVCQEFNIYTVKSASVIFDTLTSPTLGKLSSICSTQKLMLLQGDVLLYAHSY
jgi:hypothetical protein